MPCHPAGKAEGHRSEALRSSAARFSAADADGRLVHHTYKHITAIAEHFVGGADEQL